MNIRTRIWFSSDDSTIQYREWNNGALGDSWLSLEGVNNAASDPVAISNDLQHMAVFYRDTDSAIWFTEGQFGGDGSVWRAQPISCQAPIWFMGSFCLWLPEVTRGQLLALLMFRNPILPLWR